MTDADFLDVIRSTKTEPAEAVDRLAVATDVANGRLFAERFSRRFRHVAEDGRWLVWEGGRWRPDVHGRTLQAAKEIARDVLADVAERGAPAEVRRALGALQEPRLRAMLACAATEPEISVSVNELDSDPWLFACANGTLDLRTGRLRPHDPADLISRGTDVPFDLEATCPRWERFLDEVFGGDVELVSFVQKAVGYSLTGVTREEVFFVLHGTGANGKTKFLETVAKVLGEHASTAPFDSFVRTRSDRTVRDDIARLAGARFVSASESNEGRRLDEATVKMLTGGDTIAARPLYGKFFEFRPAFKIWLRTNHLPRVAGDDDAIWRRLRLIPFRVSFEGREDHGLEQALADELPGILRWAMCGSVHWRAEGLGQPPAVEQATSSYREAEDVLGMFLRERCELGDGLTVETAVLRQEYERFCDELGEQPVSARSLGRALAKRGVGTNRNAKPRRHEGVRLA